eukprot:Sspe_Gene.51496::Locus_28583_Transcript_1_1_Confidence_1.000_Length_2441::g.51496::m.51496
MAMLWSRGGGPPAMGVANQIPLLLSRLRTSTIVQDRREAVSDISALTDMTAIGEEGILTLFSCLRTDFDDPEIRDGILGIMADLLENKETRAFLMDVLKQEIQQPSSKVLDTLLMVLGEPGFHSRYNTVKILTALTEFNSDAVVKQLLNTPQGLPALMSVLEEKSHDGIIRNEGIIFMKSLVAAHEEIQKIVAFHNIFEVLFDIIRGEGGVHGGIIVEDCMDVLQHLLATNTSNQTLFRETRGLQQLQGLLTFNMLRKSESADKIIITALQILGFFLRGGSSRSPSELTATKNAMAGVPARKGQAAEGESMLCTVANLVVEPHLGPIAQFEAMRCLAHLADGHEKSQEQLFNLRGEAPWVLRIEEIIAGDSDLVIHQGAAELYHTLLQCRSVAAQVAGNLLTSVQSPQPPSPPLPGATFLHTLLSDTASPLAIYTSATLLATLFTTHTELKTPLVSDGPKGRATFPDVVQLLKTSIRGQKPPFMVASLFRLLLVWVHDCPEAIAEFTKDLTTLAFFVETANADGIEPVSIQVLSCSLVAAMKLSCKPGAGVVTPLAERAIRDALSRRIGLDHYSARFNDLRKTTAFSSPTPLFATQQPTEWDKSLAASVVDIHSAAQRSLLEPSHAEDTTSSPAASDGGTPANGHGDDPSVQVEHLRKLLKQQDIDLAHLRSELAELKKQKDEAARGGVLQADRDQYIQNLRRESLQLEQSLKEAESRLEQERAAFKLELEEERRKRAQDRKEADRHRAMAEESINSLDESRRQTEEEKAALISSLERMEERLHDTLHKLDAISSLVRS